MAKNVLYKGDCLIQNEKIESGSVDLILTDLPYGTMKGINEDFVGYGRKNHDGHLWDNVIDINKVMKLANRILRKNGKMVLFAQDPFSTELKTKALPNIPTYENPPPPPNKKLDGDIYEGVKKQPPTNKIPIGEIREDIPRKFVFNKHIIDILKLTISIILAYKCLDLIEIFICKMILYV